MQTVLLEIENVLNSRPLCYLYDDDQEDIVTPNHLLYGRKLNVNSINSDGSGNFNISMENVTKRMRYMNSVILHFWRRWSSEYVTSLREYSRVHRNTGTLVPSIADVVIVFEDKQPKQSWKLGRIVELIKSKDNKIRGVKVKLRKTKNVIGRPINRLYPVEVRKTLEKSGIDNFNMDDRNVKDEDKIELNIPTDDKKRNKRKAAVLGEIRRRYLFNE